MYGRISVVVGALALAGCGSFQLASAVYPPAGKTSEQQQLDNLSCKDRARLEANTSERQAGAFLAGLTIVGAPIAIEAEKSYQREVYKNCMEARGYRVIPANDSRVATNTASQANQGAQSAPQAGSGEAAQLERLRDLRDRGLITETEYEQKRKAVLDRL